MFITALLGAALSSFSTISTLGADIAVLTNKATNTTKSVDKISLKIEKFEDRIRRVELQQAHYNQNYIAAN